MKIRCFIVIEIIMSKNMLNLVRFMFLVVILSAFCKNIFSQSMSVNVPKEWQTFAEKTDYQQTSRYSENIDFARRLDNSSDWISYKTFGKSGEGRDLPLLIAATGDTFTPETARKSGKAVIFIQAGIHAGEIDGKDAGFALLRDIAITKTRAALLKDVVILFVPIYNTDGHENWNPYNRINQNGPDEMGFRANATNLNLNRDYMKADAPETRAWLALWNEWKPDFFIDCHVTDGADFQYNVTYEYAHFQEVAPEIKNWMDAHFDGKIVPQVEKEGNLLTHYVEFAGREITGGVATFIATPRYASGYAPLRNRPGLLIETHMLKAYKSRVRGTYDVLWKTIEEINTSKTSLFEANASADAETIEAGKTYDANRQFPLLLQITDKAEMIDFKGIEYKYEDSPVSGAKRLVYGTQPLNIKIKKFDEARISASVAPPLYYIVPPQWAEVIKVLQLHDVKFTKLTKSLTTSVESYRLTEPKWSPAPFENRNPVSYKVVPIIENRTFPVGSVVIPLAQSSANVLIHLLEPNSQDSFAYWGFFNSIFEQKEYAESYKLEKLAQEMLAKDANLKREFDEKLKDEAFAKNPRARLNFFYERSPYFTNQKVGIYPVGRITQKPDEKLLK